METFHDADQTRARLPPPAALSVDRHAVFLDIDGTLLGIEPRPEAVVADAELRDLLRRAETRMDGAVALVTGRTVADVDRIFGDAVGSVAGLHGAQRRLKQHGWLREGRAARGMEAALAALREQKRRGLLDVSIEEKGPNIALHYRHAPQSEAPVREAALALAAEHELKVLEGKMVVELLSEKTTKGDAIVEFMRSSPFAGRTPIAIGDDITDEDAFSAASRLGGAGVLVGPLRATAAKYALADFTAVRAWLAQGLSESRCGV